MPSMLFWSLPNYISPLNRKHLVLCSLALVNCGYLMFGALLFSNIESSQEILIRHNLKKYKAAFLEDNPSVTEDELEDLLEVIIDAKSKGIPFEHSEHSTWNFENSLFFVTTLITTIGYGNMAPLTVEGKCICMLLALFGIPLQLLFQTACVHHLKQASNNALKFLKNRFLPNKEPVMRQFIEALYTCSVLAAIVCAFVVLPAAIFDLMEPSWSYLDALYYCFISLSSIGLGDYVPGTDPESDQGYELLYKTATTFYLLISQPFMKLLVDIIISKVCIRVPVWFYCQEGDVESQERQPLLPHVIIRR